MSLAEIGEFGFIDRVSAGCLTRPSGVVLGIGDDCAVTRCEPGRLRLLTTDLLIERVHFLRDAITPGQLGAKALAVNLADIAAMGGTALDAFVSIAIPKDVPLAYLDALYDGMKALARQFDVNILGGDTSGSRADLVVNIALTGEVAEDRILYRSGARIGDILFVSGPLGDSAGGLDALLRGRSDASPAARELVRRHHEPQPHLEEGRAIAASGLAHAMLDVSDGLAADLPHLCDRSEVGAEVWEAELPLSPELRVYCAAHGLDASAVALSGGEDYVLLLAADSGLADALAGAGVRLHAIGRVIEAGRREVARRDGTRSPLAPGGWDHFRSGG